MRRAGKAYLAALAALLIGGLIITVVSGFVWGEAEPAGLASSPVPVTGRDLAPLMRGVGLLALAAVVVIPATRRWGRRLVGAVLAVAGLAVGAWTFRLALDLPAHVLDHLEAPRGQGEFSGASAAAELALLTAVAGLLVAASGVAVLAWGGRWPSMGARYERRARPADPTTSGRSAWEALDRGQDPTT